MTFGQLYKQILDRFSDNDGWKMFLTESELRMHSILGEHSRMVYDHLLEMAFARLDLLDGMFRVVKHHQEATVVRLRYELSELRARPDWRHIYPRAGSPRLNILIAEEAVLKLHEELLGDTESPSEVR